MRFYDKPLIAGFIPRLHHFKVACFHSITVAACYVGILLSAGFEVILQVPDLATTLGLQQYVPSQYVPLWVFAMAAISLAARLRSIVQRKTDAQSDPGVRPINP